jgi:DNA polymerase III subunit gamma/tau
LQFSIKYRPQRFSEVVGQEVATRILANSISMQRVPNALALFGLHGCGKTTLARIYAKALNCENFNGEPCCVCDSCRDIQSGSSRCVMEYDAASHSGVDDARKFEELLSFSFPGKYKVLILDECHMLTKQAQAVLLKLIEEPPVNTIFIFVTTDFQSMESTISSRCLKVDLRPVDYDNMLLNAQSILQREGVDYTEGFLTKFVKNTNGSVRDAQQILEQLVLKSGGILNEETLDDALGLISLKTYKDMAYAFNTRNTREFLEIIDAWYKDGLDLDNLFFEGVPKLMQDLLVYLSGAQSVLSYTGLKKSSLDKNLVLTLEDVKRILDAWDMNAEFMKDTVYPKIMWNKFAVAVCDG